MLNLLEILSGIITFELALVNLTAGTKLPWAEALLNITVAISWMYTSNLSEAKNILHMILACCLADLLICHDA